MASMESLTEIPAYVKQKYQYLMDNRVATLFVSSPTPSLLSDVDPKRLQASQLARVQDETMKQFLSYRMKSTASWSIIAIPNEAWAKTVYPKLPTKKAVDKLWEDIFYTCRINSIDNPISVWEQHMNTLASNNEKLNSYRFKSLHFMNSLGTDLTVDLVKNHIWCGGREKNSISNAFAPNIPTEESFCMPHKKGVSGKVVATKPLNYQGHLIENFSFTFEDGKVVDFHADKEEAILKNILETDSGSSRLGEVALIPYDSPIQNLGVLFYNTLFDENASCHLALGASYPSNVENGDDLTLEDADKIGSNKSAIHVDFMFGSQDMNIIGTTDDGRQIVVFQNGNFAI
jgi:aminopeptidase